MRPGQKEVEWRKRIYKSGGVEYPDDQIHHEEPGTGTPVILNDVKVSGNGGNPLIRVGTNGKALSGWIDKRMDIQKGDIIMHSVLNDTPKLPFIVDNVDNKVNPLNRNLCITTIRCIY